MIERLRKLRDRKEKKSLTGKRGKTLNFGKQSSLTTSKSASTVELPKQPTRKPVKHQVSKIDLKWCQLLPSPAEQSLLVSTRVASPISKRLYFKAIILSLISLPLTFSIRWVNLSLSFLKFRLIDNESGAELEQQAKLHKRNENCDFKHERVFFNAKRYTD